jgi:hypothetical protein
MYFGPDETPKSSGVLDRRGWPSVDNEIPAAAHIAVMIWFGKPVATSKPKTKQ